MLSKSESQAAIVSRSLSVLRERSVVKSSVLIAKRVARRPTAHPQQPAHPPARRGGGGRPPRKSCLRGLFTDRPLFGDHAGRQFPGQDVYCLFHHLLHNLPRGLDIVDQPGYLPGETTDIVGLPGLDEAPKERRRK